MSDASGDLAALLTSLSATVPALRGRIGPPSPDQLQCASPGNPQRIAALHAHWQRAHPGAGRHYWTTRSWTLLIWQPIYLSLLAVHLRHRAPCLGQLGQSVCDGFVGGFSLPSHSPQRGEQQELIALAAGQIGDFVERQLDEFDRVASIHPKLARLFAVDCTRAALLLVQRRLGLTNSALRELEACWLQALAMPRSSALLEVRLDDGREYLALGRNACCQHFRREDGEFCSTCPKLKPAERQRRLREELANPA